MVTYWLKIAYFCYIFATPLSFGALAPYVPPWNFACTTSVAMLLHCYTSCACHHFAVVPLHWV